MKIIFLLQEIIDFKILKSKRIENGELPLHCSKLRTKQSSQLVNEKLKKKLILAYQRKSPQINFVHTGSEIQ